MSGHDVLQELEVDTDAATGEAPAAPATAEQTLGATDAEAAPAGEVEPGDDLADVGDGRGVDADGSDRADAPLVESPAPGERDDDAQRARHASPALPGDDDERALGRGDEGDGAAATMYTERGDARYDGDAGGEAVGNADGDWVDRDDRPIPSDDGDGAEGDSDTRNYGGGASNVEDTGTDAAGDGEGGGSRGDADDDDDARAAARPSSANAEDLDAAAAAGDAPTGDSGAGAEPGAPMTEAADSTAVAEATVALSSSRGDERALQPSRDSAGGAPRPRAYEGLSCCAGCSRSATRMRACACQVPHSKLTKPMDDFGCYTCGCTGCHRTDPGPPRIPGAWEAFAAARREGRAIVRRPPPQLPGGGGGGGGEGSGPRWEGGDARDARGGRQWAPPAGPSLRDGDRRPPPGGSFNSGGGNFNSGGPSGGDDRRLEANRLEANRLAANRLDANRLEANRLSASGRRPPDGGPPDARRPLDGPPGSDRMPPSFGGGGSGGGAPAPFAHRGAPAPLAPMRDDAPPAAVRRGSLPPGDSWRAPPAQQPLQQAPAARAPFDGLAAGPGARAAPLPATGGSGARFGGGGGAAPTRPLNGGVTQPHGGGRGGGYRDDGEAPAAFVDSRGAMGGRVDDEPWRQGAGGGVGGGARGDFRRGPPDGGGWGNGADGDVRARRDVGDAGGYGGGYAPVPSVGGIRGGDASGGGGRGGRGGGAAGGGGPIGRGPPHRPPPPPRGVPVDDALPYYAEDAAAQYGAEPDFRARGSGGDGGFRGSHQQQFAAQQAQPQPRPPQAEYAGPHGDDGVGVTGDGLPEWVHSLCMPFLNGNCTIGYECPRKHPADVATVRAMLGMPPRGGGPPAPRAPTTQFAAPRQQQHQQQQQWEGGEEEAYPPQQHQQQRGEWRGGGGAGGNDDDAYAYGAPAAGFGGRAPFRGGAGSAGGGGSGGGAPFDSRRAAGGGGGSGYAAGGMGGYAEVAYDASGVDYAAVTADAPGGRGGFAFNSGARPAPVFAQRPPAAAAPAAQAYLGGGGGGGGGYKREREPPFGRGAPPVDDVGEPGFAAGGAAPWEQQQQQRVAAPARHAVGGDAYGDGAPKRARAGPPDAGGYEYPAEFRDADAGAAGVYADAPLRRGGAGAPAAVGPGYGYVGGGGGSSAPPGRGGQYAVSAGDAGFSGDGGRGGTDQTAPPGRRQPPAHDYRTIPSRM